MAQTAASSRDRWGMALFLVARVSPYQNTAGGVGSSS